MRLSLNWVADHVDLAGLQPERIAHELTMRTALIEELVDQRQALVGVLVGQVLECAPHPGADRLSVTRVDFGGEEAAHVVCGAPNVAVGQKIAYAPVGMRLPNGVKLKQAKIRGEISQGMICAEDELGLGPEHDGILVLDEQLEVGMPLAEVPGLCDVLLDIDNKSVTHRPDLWGHYGFARELGAIFDRELRPLGLATELLAADVGPRIELESGSGCPLYLGLTLELKQGRIPGSCPDWLRFRLSACGMRPLSPLVDLSNYVMLETGQPTHPFDAEGLRGGQVRVRRARDGEQLTTLDGETRRLSGEDLVIADSERVVALAGIMGGSATEVGPGTRHVFLESAAFDPVVVRRSAGRLGLRTEAVARFEKGLDPALAELATRRYARLLAGLFPEVVVSPGFRRAGASAAPERRIVLNGSMLRSRLGLDLPDERIVGTLASIGFSVSGSEKPGEWLVEPPSWRATRDVTRAEDLVEEVGRLVGYEQVPTPTPRGPLILAERTATGALEEALRDAFAGPVAATEVFSYSTLSDSVFERLGLVTEARHPRLANALQQDASRLRPCVAPSLLQHLESWLRVREQLACFEIGRAYGLGSEGQPVERSEAVLLLAHRKAKDARDLFRELTGCLQTVSRRLSLPAPRFTRGVASGAEPWLHARRSATCQLGGQVVGRLGCLTPDVMERLGVEPGEAALVTLDIAALGRCERGGSRYRPVSRFPASSIDLSFWAPYELASERIAETIRRAGPRTLIDVQGFDVYRLDDGRSLAYHLSFQSSERTLTDKEVGKARARIVRAVEQLGARLR